MGVIYNNDICNGKPIEKNTLVVYKKYIKFFSEFAMQDYYYQQFKPSALATCILVTCRKALHFELLWREEYVKLSGYNSDEIEPLFQHLWSAYLQNYPSKDKENLQSSPDDVRAVSKL